MTSLLNMAIRRTQTRDALHISGDPRIGALLAGSLQPESWTLERAPDNASALRFIEDIPYEIVVTDERASGSENVELLRKIRRLRPQSRVIVLACESTPADAIAAMREHAFSYFSAPFSPDAVAGMIRLAADAQCGSEGIEVVSATAPWIRLRAQSSFETADRVVQFLQEIAGLPDPEGKQMAMACRELLYNAIEHGCRLDPMNKVDIDYVRGREMATCRIADPGPGFAFDKIPHAAVANPADEPTHHIDLRQEQGMRPGGYGILLARELLDEVIYGQKGNEVLLVKYLASAESRTAY